MASKDRKSEFVYSTLQLPIASCVLQPLVLQYKKSEHYQTSITQEKMVFQTGYRLFVVSSAILVGSLMAEIAYEDYGHHHHHDHHDYHPEPKPYKFEYKVDDEYSGTHFQQHEGSDGDVVSGTYKVLLPDGRTQVAQNVSKGPI